MSTPLTTERKAELKPCPFCGQLPEDPVYPDDEREWIVACGGWRDDTCAVSPTAYANTEAKVIAVWNTRVPDPELAAVTRERDEAKAIVERLPKTGDGVAIVPGAALWVLRRPMGHRAWLELIAVGEIRNETIWSVDNKYGGAASRDCYASQEAALAAQSAAGGKGEVKS